MLMFILGCFCGMFAVGLVMASTRQTEIQDAYEKGRADERGYILEKIENQYGVTKPATDGGNDNG